ncbi:ATP-binding response regulator, partial [Streptomyces solincola]|uniref:ATP-binding response regulator n=1 Tax=Streptomyces solincola TaxID=2100817 RepID=UPI002158FD61
MTPASRPAHPAPDTPPDPGTPPSPDTAPGPDIAPGPEPGSAGERSLASVELAAHPDLFKLRRHGQALCRALDMDEAQRVRLITLISEAGSSLLGAAGLTADFAVRPAPAPAGARGLPGPDRLVVRFRWDEEREPSAEILAASRRLLDLCAHSGHRLELGQNLPAPRSAGRLSTRVQEELAALRGTDMSDELRNQNRELLAALEEARAQQDELQRLNEELEETNAGVMALYRELSSELEETNRGVVALYADLEDRSRRLRLASAAKTRFWANVSHELRTPVNSVIALAQLLLAADAEALTAEQHRQVSLIASSGNTLLALVEELLDTAKAESGRLEPHLRETDLRTVLYQLRGTLAPAAGAEVELDIEDAAFPGRFVTDEVMLTRILRNVLSNGLKFTAAGSVRLTARAEERADGPWAVFTVTDTGVGIPEGQLDRVFEEFYQVRGAHQRGRAGTGLGLPYARRLSELLGGRLTLTSRVGNGTRVVVELPADPPETGRARALGEGPLLRSVVIIDDDPDFVRSLGPVLGKLAEHTTEVTDSSQALRMIRTTMPDAVLVDLAMPAPDGYQVLQQIAAVPALSQVPVLILTSTDRSSLDHSRLTRARVSREWSRLLR